MTLKYHIAFGRQTDLKSIHKDAQVGKRPRHAMGMLQERLGAVIHDPGQVTIPIQLSDKLYAKLSSTPEQWALARELAPQLSSDDVVLCTGEDIGAPIAALCGAKRDRPKIAIVFHNINRPRGWVSLKLFQLANRADLFLTVCRPQADFLRTYLSLPESQVKALPDQTDTSFFTPGAPTATKSRPVIVSVGLEQRDYSTLAAATQDLDVEVKISGFSRDAVAVAQAFPAVLPANMSRRFYEWTELVQLYRDADVVVVSTVENKYAAGVQAFMEGLACRRPVVASASVGLTEYLQPEVCRVFKPGDAAGLRQAIVDLLGDRDKAEAQAQRGYEVAMQKYTAEYHVDRLVDLLKQLG